MPKLLINLRPSRTVEEHRLEFASSAASKLEPKATQVEAEDLAHTYMTLYGGVWRVVSRGGRWVVERV